MCIMSGDTCVKTTPEVGMNFNRFQTNFISILSKNGSAVKPSCPAGVIAEGESDKCTIFLVPPEV